MKRVKRFLLFACLLSIAVLLSGCWNYREVEKLAIVSGLAIDRRADKYLVTNEIINIKGGKESKISVKLISSEGASIFDAVRNTIRVTGEKLYFSHAKVVIISKELAKEGLIPIMDWISRDNEPRYTLHILISKEKSAKEILEQQPITSDILAFELDDMIKHEKSLSSAMDVQEWQYLNDISNSGISAVLPTIDLTIDNNKTTPQISGTALFKKDKLVGFLDGEETKTLMFIKDKIKGGLLTKKVNKDNRPTNIVLEILSNDTKIKPYYADGNITMKITTDTEVAIAENGGKVNYIDETGRAELKKVFETMLENSIKSLIGKVQEQYGSDIFGFGKAVKVHMPGLWKQIEPQWEKEYKNVSVEVHSTIDIKNSAFLSKPIKVGD